MIKKGDLYYSSEEFKKKAWLKNSKIYQEAAKDPIKFWEKLAKELFWFRPWKKAFLQKPPYFQWFVDGKINITSNIFENNPLGFENIKNKPALIWEPEPVEEKPLILTYGELFSAVCRFANALKKLGVKKGDRVGIYLPMIPEVVISMLSCARIGAVHTVVFSAFSPHALKIRLQDTEAKVLITADGYFRRGKIINLKENADEGAKETKVEKIIVVKRAGFKEQCSSHAEPCDSEARGEKKTKFSSTASAKASANEIPWVKDRDVWYEDLIKKQKDFCEPEIMDSEDLLFLIATSGSTGRP
ncbi:MAG: AMP-binding protein, partial [bacterium]|nr:AMP-binding protein [bacterium]